MFYGEFHVGIDIPVGWIVSREIFGPAETLSKTRITLRIPISLPISRGFRFQGWNR